MRKLSGVVAGTVWWQERCEEVERCDAGSYKDNGGEGQCEEARARSRASGAHVTQRESLRVGSTAFTRSSASNLQCIQHSKLPTLAHHHGRKMRCLHVSTGPPSPRPKCCPHFWHYPLPSSSALDRRESCPPWHLPSQGRFLSGAEHFRRDDMHIPNSMHRDQGPSLCHRG